jgi:putative transposase
VVFAWNVQTNGRPEIFNTDQGCQFSATAFTDVLKRYAIVMSMDGRGRALDNIFVERLWRSLKIYTSNVMPRPQS